MLEYNVVERITIKPIHFNSNNFAIFSPECNSDPCQNGATCVDGLVGHYTCLCDENWEGKNCDVEPPGGKACMFTSFDFAFRKFK